MHPSESCRSQGTPAWPTLQVCQAHDLASFCRQSHIDAAWRQEATHAVLHLTGGCRPSASHDVSGRRLQGLCPCQPLHTACRVCAAAQHALWPVQQPLQGPEPVRAGRITRQTRRTGQVCVCGSAQLQCAQRSSAGSSSVAPPHFVGWRPHSTWLDSRSCAYRKGAQAGLRAQGRAPDRRAAAACSGADDQHWRAGHVLRRVHSLMTQDLNG